MRASGWPKIDLAVISYVFYHYMSHDLCYDWLAAALRSGEVGAVLIVSRFENLSTQVTLTLALTLTLTSTLTLTLTLPLTLTRTRTLTRTQPEPEPES